MIRHLGRIQHSVWVTKQLNKSRSTAAVRFPNRLLCSYDDTLKNVTSFFLISESWFWAFLFVFPSSKSDRRYTQDILLQKTKERFRPSLPLDSKAYGRLQALWFRILAAVACGHQVYYMSSPHSADLLKYLWTEAPFSRTSQQHCLDGLRAPCTSTNDCSCSLRPRQCSQNNLPPLHHLGKHVFNILMSETHKSWQQKLLPR